MARGTGPADDESRRGRGEAPSNRAGKAFRWWPPRGADVSAASMAREWSRCALVVLLLPAAPSEELERDLELLISELVTNAIRHGGGVVEARLQVEGAYVRLTVRDRNPDPPDASGAADLDAEHGRGLAIVESVSARWGVDHDAALPGKAVWLDLATC
jgi:anti-sigma regulatory factor (Ser/Thr protein kinase)